ncbi:4Fe-4S binding protein [Gorillibacterium timonense]|uniref:4Fe-4S binding protein n=1 Tax=Gorillibacterium timonense TaxID=1689269 RepID=UPI00071D46DE|nr:4Fe-4S binding protein [Gorillibacterium timonense]
MTMRHQRLRRALLWTSFLLLPVTLNYFSPYLIIDGLFRGILAGSFLVWAAFFVTSLAIGRAACSYVCPYGGLQMTMDRVFGRKLKEIRWLRFFRYGLGIIWAGLILYPLIFSAVKGSLQFSPLYLTENGISADNAQKLIFTYFIVLMLALLPLFLGKRATCHYLCPMSILNIAGSKLKNRLNLPSLRLAGDKDRCISCHKCDRVCTMSLNVSNMVRTGRTDHTECILCGECTAACGTGAVTRTWRSRTTSADATVKPAASRSRTR